MVELIPVKRRGPVGRTLQRLAVQSAYLASCFLGDDVVGRRLRSLMLRAMGADLSRGSSLHGGSYLSRPTHLTMGAGSFLNRNCYLDLEERVILGRDVTVGHGTTLVTTRHLIGSHNKRCASYTAAPIRVGDGAWLGANVIVLAGVTIGSGAVVAAGALVREDVPADTLVGGVPARVLRSLEGDVEQELTAWGVGRSVGGASRDENGRCADQV
jgi:maltose O-acetyltransferase